MRTFSDFDGTYDQHPEFHGSVSAVVTGRSWQDYDVLMDDWLGLPKKPFFMNPVDKKDNTKLSIVNHKANIINKLDVDRFYEDQPDEVQMLRIMCPNCTIVQVKGGETQL